jgi:hypothetical protein
MRNAIPPRPQFVFMVWCLFKHRDNFTFSIAAGSCQSLIEDLTSEVSVRVSRNEFQHFRNDTKNGLISKHEGNTRVYPKFSGLSR